MFVNKRSFWRLFGEGRPDRRALVILGIADGGQARGQQCRWMGLRVILKVELTELGDWLNISPEGKEGTKVDSQFSGMSHCMEERAIYQDGKSWRRSLLRAWGQEDQELDLDRARLRCSRDIASHSREQIGSWMVYLKPRREVSPGGLYLRAFGT